MKKKMFSLLAVVLFVASSFNVNAISKFEEDPNDCISFAFWLEGYLGVEFDYDTFEGIVTRCEEL